MVIVIFFFFWRNKSFLEILSSCDYKIMLFSRKSRLKFLCFNTFCLSLRYSSLFVSSCNAPQYSVTRQKWLWGRHTVSSRIVGTLCCLLALPMLVWFNCDKQHWKDEETGQNWNRFQEAWIKFRGSGRYCQLKIQALLLRSFRWTN